MAKLLIKTAWGSDDPTKAAFAFIHANALAGHGHEVQIVLLGEAVTLMRTCVAQSTIPVGWSSVADNLEKTIELRVPIWV